MRTAIFGIGLLAGAVFSVVVAVAWTGPSSSPPNGNIAAPINVGIVDQIKSGALAVNALAVFGNTLLETNSYLNFGGAVGASGYGIRDNAGTLEFKTSGGQWQQIAAATTTAGGPTGARGKFFASSGMWTVPAGITSAKVTGIGAGGGSTFAYYGDGCTLNGGNGAAGVVYATGLTPGASVSITIGSPGVDGGTYGWHGEVGTGTAGSDTKFGSYVTFGAGQGTTAWLSNNGSQCHKTGGADGQITVSSPDFLYLSEPFIRTDYGAGAGGTPGTPGATTALSGFMIVEW